MNLIDRDCLVRGAAYLECALSIEDGALTPDVSPSDLIGIAAAILESGKDPELMHGMIARFFDKETADRVDIMKQLFNCPGDGGMWKIGPAYDDVLFTHPLLKHFYAHVNNRTLGMYLTASGPREFGSGFLEAEAQ